MPPEPIAFRDPAGSDYTITISACTMASIFREAARACPYETGGILIGRYDPSGWIAQIVEATPKPPGSRSGRTWFHRNNAGLEGLLKQRWIEGNYYLGEWHYHPDGEPDASDTDTRTMLRIGADPIYQCAQPILLIVGGRPIENPSVNMYIFISQKALILK